MKTTLPKNQLLTVVQNLSRIVGVSNQQIALTCVKLVVSGDVVTFTTTNNDISITVDMVGVDTEDGVCVVPIKPLLDVLKNSRGDDLLLLVKDNSLYISTSKQKNTSKTTITLIPPTDFPTTPIHTTHTTHTLPAQVFVTGFSSVYFAVSPSTIKPELTCISVQPYEGGFVFAATDSFRLVEKKVPYTVTDDGVRVPTILIPGKTAQELVFFLSLMLDSEVLWYFDEHILAIRVGDYYITTRLVQGAFPDYTRIIPKTFTTTAQFLHQDLQYVLKKASVFSDITRQVSVDLVPEKNECLFRSKNTTVGEFEESVPARIQGDSLGLNFNSKYISDCLLYIKEEGVECQFAGPGKPLVMRGVNNNSFMYLVMPMNR